MFLGFAVVALSTAVAMYVNDHTALGGPEFDNPNEE